MLYINQLNTPLPHFNIVVIEWETYNNDAMT